MVKHVIVVPHNPDWSRQFERESQVICEAFGIEPHGVVNIGNANGSLKAPNNVWM
ncbi:MAG TPA: hypothetical protein V6D20_04000 [Candidatus Obscuribacterales bacterium]